MITFALSSCNAKYKHLPASSAPIYLIKQILTYLDKLTAPVDQLQIDIQITVIKGVSTCASVVSSVSSTETTLLPLRLRNVKRKPHTYRKCTIDIELIAIGAGKNASMT